MLALRFLTILTIFFFLCINLPLQAQGWQKVYPQFAPSGLEIATSKSLLPQANGNVITLISRGLNGQQNEKFYIMEVDPQGETLREKAIEVDSFSIDGIVLTQMANGNFAVGANISPLNVGSGGQQSIYFSIWDVNFDLVSDNIISAAPDNRFVRGLVEITGGGFWMFSGGFTAPSENFLRKLDASGNPIGNEITDHIETGIGRKLILEPGGGVTVVMYERITGGFDYSTLLNEFDSNGVFINQVIFDHNGGQLIPVGIDRTNDGGYIIAGRNIDNKQVLLKLDQNKIEEWRKEYIPASNFLAYFGVKTLPNSQGYRILYYEQDPSLVNPGLIETDINGNWIYKRTYFQNFNCFPEEIVLLPDGGTILSGYRGADAQLFSNNIQYPYLIRTDAFGFTYGSGVSGTVQLDTDDNCTGDNLDNIPGRLVGAFDNGNLMNATQVDSSGGYLLMVAPDDYKLAVQLPNGLWSSCQDSVDITVIASDTLSNVDFVLAYNPEPLDSIYGYMFEDYDDDCVLDSFEMIGYEGWIVNLEISEDGSTDFYQDTTDVNGYYSFTDLMGATTGAIVYLQFIQPIGTGLNCAFPCWQELYLSAGPDPAINFNNGVTCDTLPFCPIMYVSINTNQIRPCLEGSYYVSYQNIGGATAMDAFLEVTIDSALTIIDASIPWTSQVGNLLTFDLGDLLSNQYGSFWINFDAPCDDPTGTTYCSEAYAFPDSTCVPPGTNWDGSEIEVAGECLGDSIRFKITNIGDGNMSSTLDYVIIEDNVLLNVQPGGYQLEVDEFMEVTLANNADFYRMEAMQPDGFPGLATPISWVEGCGTADPTMGFTNQYPLGDEDPWFDIFCQESINSYDPNDKQGFPRGVDDENYIDQNVAIEYMVRFQNTGTAEAIYIEIRDTLATQWLNPATLRPGASSHDYTWDIEGNGILVFKFLNINLPDSTSNPEGSNGFVSFKIQQHADNPIGTEILNTAAIYFDNNPPIITNETLHTIGEDFLSTVNISNSSEDFINQIQLIPNPTTNNIHVVLDDFVVHDQLTISLYDVFGRIALSEILESKNGHMLALKSLAPGTYFYQLYDGVKNVGTGKLIKI